MWHVWKRREIHTEVWKPEGKRRLGINRHTWKYNIKKDIDKIGGFRLD